MRPEHLRFKYHLQEAMVEFTLWRRFHGCDFGINADDLAMDLEGFLNEANRALVALEEKL